MSRNITIKIRAGTLRESSTNKLGFRDGIKELPDLFVSRVGMVKRRGKTPEITSVRLTVVKRAAKLLNPQLALRIKMWLDNRHVEWPAEAVLFTDKTFKHPFRGFEAAD